MPYCRLFYHFVWATKNRERRITAKIEPAIYNYLRTKAIGLGATVFAINGGKEHVHVATTVPARIAVSTFVGQIKGVTSTRFNKDYRTDPPFSVLHDFGRTEH